MKSITIDTDLGLEYQDEGPWRSYNLTTNGSSLQELLDNATISEVDQDGGDLDYYGFNEASNKIQELVDVIIAKEFLKGDK